jgi:undecaprenyl diphosphate synthase
MHLALILDGNRRWAKSLGKSTAYGHRKGIGNLKTILPAVIAADVTTVTCYALSTENIKERSPLELKSLYAIFRAFAANTRIFDQHRIRVKIIGRLDLLPANTRDALQKLVKHTSKYAGLTLNLAIGYGGRDEIVRAVSRLRKSGKPTTEKNLASCLDTAGQSDPDLLVRTGRKSRTSNFLPWQLAYTELYFTDKYWPEFDAAELAKALEWYHSQKRTFGK